MRWRTWHFRKIREDYAVHGYLIRNVSPIVVLISERIDYHHNGRPRCKSAVIVAIIAFVGSALLAMMLLSLRTIFEEVGRVDVRQDVGF